MRKLANNLNSYDTSLQVAPNHDKCDVLCPTSSDDFFSHSYHYLIALRR